MKRLIACILFVSSLIACSTTKSAETFPSETEAHIAIAKVMNMQEEAWSNGNIDAFMEGYWNSENLTFIGKQGLSYGWRTTLNNYKKGYPDKSSMGDLQFDILRLDKLAPDVYHMIGRYTLIRKDDQPQGYFTLIWKYIDGAWKIVSDHTSG